MEGETSYTKAQIYGWSDREEEGGVGGGRNDGRDDSGGDEREK